MTRSIHKTILILISLLLGKQYTYAQYNTPQNRVWIFGRNAGLNFNSGSPVPVSLPIYMDHGTASVCDASGNLLFYTNGDTVKNRLGAIMPNGGGIAPYHTFGYHQPAVIAPVVGSPDKYYVFALRGTTSSIYAQLVYSIVDMTLAGGMGDVVTSSMGTVMNDSMAFKMITIPGNNCNLWLIVHERGNNHFRSYEISSSGINTTPVISASGILPSYSLGLIKSSHDGRKIINMSENGGSIGGFELHDFDPNTGIVYNARRIDTILPCYSGEFSSDDTKVYITAGSTVGGLYQYDISLPTLPAIIASKINIKPYTMHVRDLKLGPDDKIYVRKWGTPVIAIATSNYLDRIENPNLAGTACTFVDSAVNLSPGVAWAGFPNIFYTTTLKASNIFGPSSICQGASIFMVDSVGGGVWTSSNPSVATVGSSSGHITGVSAGVAIITYTLSNYCGTSYVTKLVTVNTNPAVITGIPNLCVGTTTPLNNITGGGVWSSGNPAIATIGSNTGVVTGVAGGTATITYTLATGCYATILITVISLPGAGTITGPSALCTGQTITLTNTTGTGVWSSSNTARAIVGSSSGIVTGISAGTVTISYTVTYTCGSATATKAITVNASPSTISGDSIICGSGSITLSNAVAGGVWGSSNATAATIGPGSGVVTGVSPGAAVITYTLPGGCYETKTITVNPMPDAGIIQNDGTNSFCVGEMMNIWDTTAGGVWSITNGNATLSGSTLTAVTPGEDTVMYIVSNVCGTDTAFFYFTVSGIPPEPYGNHLVCIGDTLFLKDSVGGGMWSGGGPIVGIYTMFIDSCAVVGRSAGVASLTYSLDLGCTVTFEVTVNPLPNAGAITGQDRLCIGATTLLKNDVTGGVWGSSDTSTATIGANGFVTAKDTGTTYIIYTVPANIYGCTNTDSLLLSVILPNFTVPGTVTNIKCYDGNDGTIELGKMGANILCRYLWSTGATTPTVQNLAAGVYTVTVTDTNTQCKVVETFTISQPDSLTIISEVKKDICQSGKGSITLNVSGGTSPYTYAWSNGKAIKDPDGLTSGSYKLLLKDVNGCSENLSILVEDTCTGIVVYNGVSPNGDGLNDTWIIEGIQLYPASEVQVYDKWGDMVFSKTGYQNDWNGGQIPDGTYFYLIKLNTAIAAGGKDTFTGALLIKR